MSDLSKLQDLQLPEATGGELRVGDLWAERPLAIAWLRHYA